MMGRFGRALSPRNIGALATAAVLALAPLAAFAQDAGVDYLKVSAGRPFPLWFFLLGAGGAFALLAAYAAKGAVERR